jgi:hypothetical protein
MDIKVLAAVVLVGQSISFILMATVLMKQLSLFKLYIEPELKRFRLALFLLALVIFLGNIVPTTISVLTLTDTVTRSVHHINLVGMFYSMTNTLVATFSSILIWLMYRLAKKTATLVEHDKAVASKAKK